MFAVRHLLSLVFHVFISIAFTVRSSKSSSFMIIIIGIQLARCTRVASRESLPRAVAETVTHRDQDQDQDRDRDRARPWQRLRLSHETRQRQRRRRTHKWPISAAVGYILCCQQRQRQQRQKKLEAPVACIRAHRTSNMLHVVFEVRAVCSVATVLFIFRQTLSEGTTAAYA